MLWVRGKCVTTSTTKFTPLAHVIRGLSFNVIRGPRPVNLKDHRIKSGDDGRVVQCGRSMIEMLGVLAIIAVLSVGGIAGYSKAMTKFKTNKLAEEVATIVTNIKTLYAQQKSYEGLDNEAAYLMGILPEDLGSYNSYQTNIFGGTIYLTASYNTFEIYYEGLPKETCISLATNNWTNTTDLIAIEATNISSWDLAEYTKVCNGKITHYNTNATIAIACTGGSNIPIPMPIETAIEACKCRDNDCTIGWKYE